MSSLSEFERQQLAFFISANFQSFVDHLNAVELTEDDAERILAVIEGDDE